MAAAVDGVDLMEVSSHDPRESADMLRSSTQIPIKTKRSRRCIDYMHEERDTSNY